MYDLNRAIEDWKSAFAGSETCGRENVEELESHLRDEIAALTEAGLSEKEAFHVARSRLGDPIQICSQFAQADPSLVWKSRLFWMAAGVFCWLSITLCQRVLLAVVDMAALSLGIRTGVELGIINTVASVFSLLLIVLGCTLLYSRRTRSFRLAPLIATRARVVLCVVGVVLAGLIGKSLVVAPMMYASHVLSPQDVGVYAMYRSLCGRTLSAVLATVIIVYVISRLARRCGRSAPATG